MQRLSAKPAAPRKTCSRCRTPKPHSDFYRMSASKDGLQAWCKECSKETRETYSKSKGRRTPKVQLKPQLVKDVASEVERLVSDAAAEAQPPAVHEVPLSRVAALEALVGEHRAEAERLAAQLEEAITALAEKQAKIDALKANGAALTDESEGRLREIQRLREQLQTVENERDEAVTVADLQHDALLTLSVYTCALQGLVARTGNPKWIEFANGAETIIQGVLPLWKLSGEEAP